MLSWRDSLPARAGGAIFLKMPNRCFRSVAIAGAAALALIAAAPIAAVASEAPAGHIWTELEDPAHVAKVQTMPDFVELAAKLSPAVVNISTEEPERSAEGEDPLPGLHRK